MTNEDREKFIRNTERVRMRLAQGWVIVTWINERGMPLFKLVAPEGQGNTVDFIEATVFEILKPKLTLTDSYWESGNQLSKYKYVK